MARNASSVNILLVNPWIVDFKAFDLWMKPMGLLYISSVLKRNGFNVSLIDCMDRNAPSVRGKKKVRLDGTGKFCSEEIEKPDIYKDIPRRYKRYGISLDSFKKRLRSIPTPKTILVTSMMTYWYMGVHEAILILKEFFPGVPIILGGIYPTLCEAFAGSFSGAGIVFTGTNLSRLVSLIDNIVYTHSSFKPESFLEYPYPDFSFYDVIDYCPIITSLGCPYNCTYCASKQLQPKYMRSSPKKVINEILLRVKNFNIKNFAFYDDALLVDADNHIKVVLNEIIKRDLDIYFHTPNGLHARFIDEELAQMMKKSGFKTIRLSLETSNADTLNLTGNKVRTSDIEKSLENLLKFGFTAEDIAIYILMGIPQQTYEEVDNTIDYVYSLGFQSRLSMYSPIPKTKDFIFLKDKYYNNLLDEPLSHNNTYQYYKGRWTDMKRRKFLYDKTYKLNKKILNSIYENK